MYDRGGISGTIIWKTFSLAGGLHGAAGCGRY